jgi:hypothetical protein
MNTEIKDILAKIDSIKSVLDGYRPFPDHIVKQLRDYYRIGMTYTSNAIEGNTLSESEIKVIINDVFCFYFLQLSKIITKTLRQGISKYEET